MQFTVIIFFFLPSVLLTFLVCCFVVWLLLFLTLPIHQPSHPTKVRAPVSPLNCVFVVAVKRNSLGSDVLFIGKSHLLFDFVHELYRTEAQEVTNPKLHTQVN